MDARRLFITLQDWWSCRGETPEEMVARKRRALGYAGTPSRTSAKREVELPQAKKADVSGAILGIYSGGFSLTSVLAFFASWVYCISEYGYLLGFGLGWLPSLFFACIVGAIWPLVAVFIVYFVLSS